MDGKNYPETEIPVRISQGHRSDRLPRSMLFAWPVYLISRLRSELWHGKPGLLEDPAQIEGQRWALRSPHGYKVAIIFSCRNWALVLSNDRNLLDSPKSKCHNCRMICIWYTRGVYPQTAGLARHTPDVRTRNRRQKRIS